MVDTELLMEKAKRSAFVGAGAFMSGWVGEKISGASDDLDARAVAVGKIGLGVGASVIADDDDLLTDLGSRQDSMQSMAVEYTGYGLSGAGFAELGESLDIGFGGDDGGSSSRRKSRRVSRSRSKRTRRTDGGNVSSDRHGGNSTANGEEFLVDA
jgi:hypothetical protein